jgi:hypothetical protein
MTDVNTLRGMVVRILEDSVGRKQAISDFQEIVCNTVETLGSEAEDVVLRDLAHDLDFYEPDPRARLQDAAFYDDARLETDLRSALRTLDSLNVKSEI